MTPERAAELIQQVKANWQGQGLDQSLQIALYQACKEQKEADAKICEAIAEPMYPHAQGPYLDCAKAIRSAE